MSSKSSATSGSRSSARRSFAAIDVPLATSMRRQRRKHHASSCSPSMPPPIMNGTAHTALCGLPTSP
eukprot:CAMPEP_0206131004 /NCGR_PEP_ID=MMETSP1472-20131121/43384_1 /ASSEMBLY_ACC=CAM_ASM_001108 /TAXON_ID=41880 /ORGANISM="Pycnococcus provasolii, Strain RCC251" /LENGTH=66 /DNA_ID=CAMNT_0053522417 /DNA_START=311 /DNA_END=511 /DNA_ORIENTATION=+